MDKPIVGITDHAKFKKLVEEKYHARIIETYTGTDGFEWLVLNNGTEIRVDIVRPRVGRLTHHGILSPRDIGQTKYSELGIRQLTK